MPPAYSPVSLRLLNLACTVQLRCLCCPAVLKLKSEAAQVIFRNRYCEEFGHRVNGIIDPADFIDGRDAVQLLLLQPKDVCVYVSK